MRCRNDFPVILAGVVVSIIFGLSFLFTKQGLDFLQPFHLLGLRFAVATTIFVLLRITGVITVKLKGKSIKKILGLTLLEPVIYFICETIGINMTSSSEAGIIIALIPVFTVILGVIYLKEKPSLAQTGFILLSVSGIIFMIMMKGSVQVGGNVLGSFILLGSVLSASWYNVMARKLSSEFSPVEITYMMVWVGAVVFNGIAFVQHMIQGTAGQYFALLANPGVIISIVYLGAFSSVIAYFLLNYLLSKIEVSRVSIISNVATVVSVMAGAIFRNEPIYWFNIIGGLMILFGAWGTNWQNKRMKGNNFQNERIVGN